MTDFYHDFGEDLQLDPEGALLDVSGGAATQQAILRRLCTNPQGYLFHVDYGAGLPARIGMPIREGETRALIVSQLALEAGIDQGQPVTVVLTSLAVSTFRCTLSYTDRDERVERRFTFNQDGTI